MRRIRIEKILVWGAVGFVALMLTLAVISSYFLNYRDTKERLLRQLSAKNSMTIRAQALDVSFLFGPKISLKGIDVQPYNAMFHVVAEELTLSATWWNLIFNPTLAVKVVRPDYTVFRRTKPPSDAVAPQPSPPPAAASTASAPPPTPKVALGKRIGNWFKHRYERTKINVTVVEGAFTRIKKDKRLVHQRRMNFELTGARLTNPQRGPIILKADLPLYTVSKDLPGTSVTGTLKALVEVHPRMAGHQLTGIGAKGHIDLTDIYFSVTKNFRKGFGRELIVNFDFNHGDNVTNIHYLEARSPKKSKDPDFRFLVKGNLNHTKKAPVPHLAVQPGMDLDLNAQINFNSLNEPFIWFKDNDWETRDPKKMTTGFLRFNLNVKGTEKYPTIESDMEFAANRVKLYEFVDPINIVMGKLKLTAGIQEYFPGGMVDRFTLDARLKDIVVELNKKDKIEGGLHVQGSREDISIDANLSNLRLSPDAFVRTKSPDKRMDLSSFVTQLEKWGRRRQTPLNVNRASVNRFAQRVLAGRTYKLNLGVDELYLDDATPLSLVGGKAIISGTSPDWDLMNVDFNWTVQQEAKSFRYKIRKRPGRRAARIVVDSKRGQ